MSADFSLVCHICKVHIHLGQLMAGGQFSAGYGPHDVAGRQEIAHFLLIHDHEELAFMDGQKVPGGYQNEGSP